MADDERQDPDHTRTRLELPSLKSAFRRRTHKTAESAQSDDEITPTRHVTTRRKDLLTEEARPRLRRRVRMNLPGPLAALVTGAVVGLVLVGLTVAALHLCSVMRGTSSCGKPGIVLLLAITAVAIVLGSLLLRMTGVAAHGSTSFLGVGLLDVLILLAFLPILDESWVVIAVPVLAMVTFLAAWWLTTTYVEPGERTH